MKTINIIGNVNTVHLLDEKECLILSHLSQICKNDEKDDFRNQILYDYLFSNTVAIDLIKILYSLEYPSSTEIVCLINEKYFDNIAYLMTIGNIYIKFYNFLHYLKSFPALPQKLIDELVEYDMDNKILINNYPINNIKNDVYFSNKYNHVGFIGYMRLYLQNDIKYNLDERFTNYTDSKWLEFIKNHQIYKRKFIYV